MASGYGVLEARLAAELRALREQGQKRAWRVLEGATGARVVMDGREVVLLASNNYLGLANHPRVVEAAIRATEQYGNGPGAARQISGTTTVHTELERRLAEFTGYEAALLYNSAFMTNVGLLTAILQRGDYVFSDELNHASIIDGCRLSRGEAKVYPHRDIAALDRLLGEVAEHPGLKVVISDGVFSMEGDIAPIPDLLDVCERHGAVLVVDEAHATGVLGPNGRGSVEHYGLQGRVPISTSTLGKTLGGALGGFVAGSRDLIEFLARRSRNFVFTNPIPPAVAAGAVAALDVVAEEPERRTRLFENAAYLRSGLERIGLHTVGHGTPIVPVVVGETTAAFALSEKLFERGVFVQAFGFPVVPKGEARLRNICMATHTREDLDLVLSAYAAAAAELGLLA